MARSFVVDEAEGTRFPFLRGILTRSLQSAGVPFEAAYALASEIRSELDDVEELSTKELRERVVPRLEPFGADVIQRYLGPPVPDEVSIRFEDGHQRPFSRGRHRQSLASCGISPEDAATTAARIYDDLVQRHVQEIQASELRHLTHGHLLRELGEEAAQRYLVWQAYQRSKRPLVLVIGGTVGSGKSTVAAQVAHRLEIVRFQSTDMLREVMRMMVPSRLMPALHTSTFKAWQTLPTANPSRPPTEAQLADGYLTQAKLVSVACDAVLRRAMRERVSLILEGVHAHPNFIEPPESDAILVRVMLAVLKRSRLRRRIRGRGEHEPDRRAKRYLTHFDAIWNIQSLMLSEADQLGVPIVPNEDLDRTVQEVIGVVMSVLASQFSGTPEEVFG